VDPTGESVKSALKLIKSNRDSINRAASIFEIDPVGIASVIFQEKYYGLFADAKNCATFIVDCSFDVNDDTPKTRSYGLAEMQLQTAADLLGENIDEPGVKKKMYDLLCDDAWSIALIAAYIKKNEKILNRKLNGYEAGYAHNMGAKRYNDYLNNKNPPNNKVPKRSENYQKSIKDALNGVINTTEDSNREK